MPIHETAIIEKEATLGENVSVWHHSIIRGDVIIGNNCIIGSNVYIDEGVRIGNNVKIQNNACIYRYAKIEDGVFIGPGALLINDKIPRAVTPDGKLKTACDWKCGTIVVEKGASVGAGSIILPDVKIGSRALVGAGSVVTKNVPPNTLVVGNPAQQKGLVPDN